ncbi:hypothetical protein C5C56_14465 [Rathayibacter sp. AY1D1]|uniref:hypothetical protein n=1 Tax=unclassified Rathayibacter TaxID=2609250 RepID=UPI000CE9154F|nr:MULTISPECIES: hypothetical protein [unclassified Rathayibacter]PPH31270.1 hypothetical protein C5C37_01875 [Rathayibacter sp. AY1F9]PPH74575.1 hypothetical protein C5C90_10815 [Rathayibacter sp. AY1D4]PPH79344.1 hypothetical protein C5C50_12945 [Rathayibacter sp. AY1D9]PPH85517.1 hypothetical protein C5C64_16120 [Rathayibacter sp. AY1D3]PPH96469.1 hypothetical protein C5C56_14465 [Rathayibacter sp. AY1D1]
MTELIIEIHIPLVADPSISADEYPYPWIDDVQNHLATLDGPGEEYDDGEEWATLDGDPEYLFFLDGATEPELLAIARDVAQLPGVPTGVYATANDPDGDMGQGRRIDLGL